MPRKIPRPDSDVERLAAQLRGRWVPADGIEPWLRRNVQKLSRLVSDQSWSWSDIGKAMTLAGIVYQSGRPWTGRLLTAKAAQVRNQIRQRKARLPVGGAGARATDTAQPPASDRILAPGVEVALPVSDQDVSFEIARLPRAVSQPPRSVPPERPAEQSRRDPDEVIAALLARPKAGSIPMPPVPEPDDEDN